MHFNNVEKRKLSKKIFFFRCPFLDATQSHILKFPRYQSYSRLHCSPLISEVSVTANRPIRTRQSPSLENSLGVPPRTFHPAAVEKSKVLVFLPPLINVFSGCQLGERNIDLPPKSKPTLETEQKHTDAPLSPHSDRAAC